MKLDPIEPWPICKKEHASEMLWMAVAYAKAADVLCDGLIDDVYERNFSSVKVIFHLCRHATELYLKGAVFLKTKNIPKKTHRLDELYISYRKYFNHPKNNFDFPFENELFSNDGGFFPESLNEYHKNHDQRFKYPFDKDGNSFDNFKSFDILEYKKIISKFHNDLNLNVASIDLGFELK